MRTAYLRNLTMTGASVVAALSFTTAVSAQSTGQMMYQTNLLQTNNSGTSGTATVQLTGNQVTVTVNTSGASANLPHAQAIRVGGSASCPVTPTGTNRDGEPNTVSTTEAAKNFGDVKIALTTTGDVSPTSALAVDRMPKADAAGNVSYSRTFALPAGVTAADMANGVIVQHGIAKLTGNKATYDGTKKSELDKSLPAEATLPAACGKLASMPNGGVAAGGGSTASNDRSWLFGVGAIALLVSGGLAITGVRREAALERSK